MKFMRSKFLAIGVLAGILTGGGWLAWAAIQSQVGVNWFNTTTGVWLAGCNAQVTPTSDGEVPSLAVPCAVGDVDSILHIFNGTSYDRVRSASIGDNQPATGIFANLSFLFNGTTFDRPRSSSNASDSLATSTLGNANQISFPFLFNGTNFDRLRDGNSFALTPANVGVLPSGFLIRNPSTGLWTVPTMAATNADGAAGNQIISSEPSLYNGSTFDRQRSISATNLTATTSVGSNLNVQLSTWSVTSTPAAATQATASKAAGGGTVRHVATTITVCIAAGATAQTPIAVNLRDGATGAGTVLRTWKFSVPINTSTCSDLSGLAMIGTANTAMTLEFAAAGAAATEQTVTLTGFSVP